ncbi:hypothetical protein GCM10020001_098940 [Nonomuraea salmonea]
MRARKPEQVAQPADGLTFEVGDRGVDTAVGVLVVGGRQPVTGERGRRTATDDEPQVPGTGTTREPGRPAPLEHLQRTPRPGSALRQRDRLARAGRRPYRPLPQPRQEPGGVLASLVQQAGQVGEIVPESWVHGASVESAA